MRLSLSSSWLPVLLLLIAIISIQSSASLAKTLFPAIGAEGVTALRLGFSSLILLSVYRPWRFKISLKAWRAILFYGAALGGMNLTFYMALQTIPLGIAVALEFTGPLCVAMFSSRRGLDFVWLGLAIFGLYLLLPLSEPTESLDPKGMILALTAGMCWALYIVFGRRAGTAAGALSVPLGTLVAALLVLPVGIAHAGTGLLSGSILPIALVIAIFSSALPYALEMVALTRIPPQAFGTLMSVEPAMAALSGYLFLGEVLTLTQWLSLLCIIVASVGTTLSLKRAQ